MKIKKIVLIFICLFVFSGCSIDNISNNNIEKNVDLILKKRIKKVNTNAVGYQYYLPKYMSVIDSNEFNQEIYYKGNKFYLYADVVSYYHKESKKYKISEDSYISKEIKKGNKKGYLQVDKVGKRYYIQMMYNYAKVEGYTTKEDLKDSISGISLVLSSVKYNDNVIETLLGDKKYDLKNNETYNIFKAKKSKEGNFLDYVNEYDNYKGNEDLNNLIEKEEIKSEDEED